MKTKMTLIAALFSLFFLPSMLMAQDSSLNQLKQRFKERYPQIQQLKGQGAVGETTDGYLDFVDKKDPKAAEVVDKENADRKELYQLIAKKEGVKPEVVAERNAKRNFDKAKPGEFLKEDGKWHKKT